MQVTEWLRFRCYGKQMSTARPSPVNKWELIRWTALLKVHTKILQRSFRFGWLDAVCRWRNLNPSNQMPRLLPETWLSLLVTNARGTLSLLHILHKAPCVNSEMTINQFTCKAKSNGFLLFKQPTHGLRTEVVNRHLISPIGFILSSTSWSERSSSPSSSFLVPSFSNRLIKNGQFVSPQASWNTSGDALLFSNTWNKN